MNEKADVHIKTIKTIKNQIVSMAKTEGKTISEFMLSKSLGTDYDSALTIKINQLNSDIHYLKIMLYVANIFQVNLMKKLLNKDDQWIQNLYELAIKEAKEELKGTK